MIPRKGCTYLTQFGGKYHNLVLVQLLLSKDCWCQSCQYMIYHGIMYIQIMHWKTILQKKTNRHFVLIQRKNSVFTTLLKLPNRNLLFLSTVSQLYCWRESKGSRQKIPWVMSIAIEKQRTKNSFFGLNVTVIHI